LALEDEVTSFSLPGKGDAPGDSIARLRHEKRFLSTCVSRAFPLFLQHDTGVDRPPNRSPAHQEWLETPYPGHSRTGFSAFSPGEKRRSCPSPPFLINPKGCPPCHETDFSRFSDAFFSFLFLVPCPSTTAQKGPEPIGAE